MLIGNTIREGFKLRSFIADSGRPLSYTVQFANSGKCSCTCAYFTRNNICHHCIAAAMRAGKFDDLVASFSTRSRNQMTTSTAPTSVDSKRPPKIRKRTEEGHPFQQTEDEKALQSEPLTSQTVGEITLLIRKKKKPDDPIPMHNMSPEGLLEECKSAQDAEEISPRQSKDSMLRTRNISFLAVSRHILIGTRTATLTSQLCQRDTTF